MEDQNIDINIRPKGMRIKVWEDLQKRSDDERLVIIEEFLAKKAKRKIAQQARRQDQVQIIDATMQDTDILMDGNACEFPVWSFSKKKCSEKGLKINFEDNSYVEIDAPKGFPGIEFPGYLDVLLANGQKNLFGQNYIEMSVYQILQTLGKDPDSGANNRNFRKEMEKSFAMAVKTDRLIDSETGERTHTTYFRIFDSMQIAKRRNQKSRFYLNNLFCESIKAGYLKHLDYTICLNLDREGQALARFLYQHIVKRLGGNMYYVRNLEAFLNDVGVGYVLDLDTRYKNRYLKKIFYPAIDRVVEEGIFRYELVDAEKNIVFYSPRAKKTLNEYRNQFRLNMKKKNAARAQHEEFARTDPQLYINMVDNIKSGKSKKGSFFEDIYQRCLVTIK